MSYLINELKNITTSYKVITSIIKKKRVGLKFKDDETLLTLLEYHPTKNIKKSNIEYLVVRIRPPFNTLSLFYKMDNKDHIEDDVSYRLCLQVLFKKYDKQSSMREDIMSALRSECCYGTKKTFFETNTVQECRLCQTTINIVVDHVGITYQNILDRFLEETSNVLESFEIYENTINNEIRLTDNNLAEEWLNFHDSLATYRFLCKTCNLRCGSYGYISKNKLAKRQQKRQLLV